MALADVERLTDDADRNAKKLWVEINRLTNDNVACGKHIEMLRADVERLTREREEAREETKRVLDQMHTPEDYEAERKILYAQAVNADTRSAALLAWLEACEAAARYLLTEAGLPDALDAALSNLAYLRAQDEGK